MELVELLELTSVFLTRGGWGLLSRSCYPDQKAYRNAMYRLRKDGLVVRRSEKGETPQIVLTEPGQSVLPDYFHPNKFWGRKWNGIWYLFVYDVPEVDRKYRDVLRRFLKRLRLGCLQQSVWVTPYDIRPQFDDLTKAAGVDSFAYLFESRTVLKLSNLRVVNDAWQLNRLYEIQVRYCDALIANLSQLSRGGHDHKDLASLLRISLEGYHVAFAEDPLLPRKLLPHNYQGERACDLYRQLLSSINLQL